MEDVQQLIAQFQSLQQRNQMVAAQLDVMKAQLIETEKALEELGKSGEESVYKSIGTILVKKPKKDVEKELAERRGLLDARIKGLEKELKRVDEKLQELQKNIKSKMPE